MKILVISLLRLGDILMAAPAVHGLRKKYPHAEIDMMVNKPFAIAAPMFPEVKSFYSLDRQCLQDSMVSRERPLIEAFDKLKNFCDELNLKKYDLVVNLTQNKLSGYICSYIQSENKNGMSLNARNQVQFNSAWFKYINDVVSAGVESIFHYSDIYYAGLELPMGDQSMVFKETLAGQKELEELFSKSVFSSASKKIAIQFTTSDEKKNWKKESWIETIKKIKMLNEQTQIFLICSPSEEKQAEELRRDLKNYSVQVEVAKTSIQGAHALLNVCDLLITGDTSIKHLASGSSAKILEICLGSSDLRKTGAYKPGSIILKSREECAPCNHFMKCSRSKHECGESIEPTLVALLALKIIENDWQAVRILAKEYEDKVEIYKTYLSRNGFWSLECMNHQHVQQTLGQHLDKLAWKLLLQKEHLKPLAEYGTEGHRFSQDLLENFSEANSKLLRLTIEQMQYFTEAGESKINKVLAELARRLRESNALTSADFIDKDLRSEISRIEKDLGLGQLLSEKLNISHELGLFRARQLQLSLNDVFQHLQIKSKILRSLKNQIMEYQ